MENLREKIDEGVSNDSVLSSGVKLLVRSEDVIRAREILAAPQLADDA